MKALMETDDILGKHADAIAFARAKLIDGYCQIYIKKKPWFVPKFLYRWIIKKTVVLAFFKENL